MRKCGSMEVIGFWISVNDEYPMLSGKALQILIEIMTSYLYEAGFSAVTVIKASIEQKTANDSGCVQFDSKISLHV